MTYMEVVDGHLEIFLKQNYANIYNGRLPKKSAVETNSMEVVLCKNLIAKMTSKTTYVDVVMPTSVKVVCFNV